VSANNKPRIKILLVEDHPVVRAGLQIILSEAQDFEVVGWAANGAEGAAQASALKPDVILMDVGMPLVDGIEAVRRIRANDPSAKIIMLTASDNERDIFASLAAGANGYCLKEAAPERLSAAIRCVNAGDVWLDAAIAGKVMAALPDPSAVGSSFAIVSAAAEKRTYNSLSDRERDVLQLLVEGLSNIEIAERLIISRETVKTHVRHIMDKLAVSDRIQVAVKALRHGLV